MIRTIARDELSFFFDVAHLITIDHELPLDVSTTSTLRCVVAFTQANTETFETFYAKATEIEKAYTIPIFILSFVVDDNPLIMPGGPVPVSRDFCERTLGRITSRAVDWFVNDNNEVMGGCAKIANTIAYMMVDGSIAKLKFLMMAAKYGDDCAASAASAAVRKAKDEGTFASMVDGLAALDQDAPPSPPPIARLARGAPSPTGVAEYDSDVTEDFHDYFSDDSEEPRRLFSSEGWSIIPGIEPVLSKRNAVRSRKRARRRARLFSDKAAALAAISRVSAAAAAVARVTAAVALALDSNRACSAAAAAISATSAALAAAAADASFESDSATPEPSISCFDPSALESHLRALYAAAPFESDPATPVTPPTPEPSLSDFDPSALESHLRALYDQVPDTCVCI